MFARVFFGIGLVLLSFLGMPLALASADQARSYEEQIAAASLEIRNAVSAEGLELEVPGGTLRFIAGLLAPATPVGGHSREWVFAGRAQLQVTPPNEIEADQLEFFAETRALNYEISKGVLVLGQGDALAEVEAQPPFGAADTEAASQWAKTAEKQWDTWRRSMERESLEVPARLLRSTLEAEPYASYLVLATEDPKERSVALIEDPEMMESARLLCFVPIEWTTGEKWDYKKYVKIFKGAGFVKNIVYLKGFWDTWLSWSNGPSALDVEPRHYELEVTLGKNAEDVTGIARIDLESMRDGLRSLKLHASSSIKVHSCRLEGGEDLFFHVGEGETLVLLDQGLARGERIRLVIEYELNSQVKIRRGVYTSLGPRAWYPHAGREDLATYEVLYRWPGKVDLLASGDLLESGEEGDQRWQRRRLDIRSNGVTFRVGTFELHTSQVGHVALTVAFSKDSKRWMTKEGKKHLAYMAGAILRFSEQLFGPYPLDTLTIATTPDSYSQGLLGLITLGEGGHSVFSRDADYRITLAHEMAHQWWGNMVVPASYRDEWLSEGIAEYASILFGRHVLRPSKARFKDPFKNWKRQLTRQLSVTRTVEQVGPFTLGRRLDSSKCSSCYEVLNYIKAGKVTDMLAQMIGEDPFLNALEHLAQSAAGTRISTEYFFKALSQMNHTDLDWFVERYVHGTTSHTLIYSTSHEEVDSGRFRVSFEFTQEPDTDFVFGFVPLASGHLDIRTRRKVINSVADSRFVLPYIIEGEDKEKQVKKGRITVKGLSSHATVTVPFEPKRTVVDPDQTALVWLTQEKTDSLSEMQMKYREADKHWTQGDLEKALATADEALLASTGKREKEFAAIDRFNINKLRTTLLLDLQRPGDAKQAMPKLSSLRVKHRAGRGQALVVRRARILLQEGQSKKAYGLLWKEVHVGSNRLIRAFQLLAIAALEQGEQKVAEAAIKVLEAEGIDTTPLEPLRTAR